MTKDENRALEKHSVTQIVCSIVHNVGDSTKIIPDREIVSAAIALNEEINKQLAGKSGPRPSLYPNKGRGA